MSAEIAVQGPGIYYDMSAVDYHAAPGLSNSGMKDLAVSPLRYWYLHINPAPKEEEDDTKATVMGSALHCAVLESDAVFESRYVRALDASDWPVCLETVGQIREWVEARGGKCKGTIKADVISSALDFMKVHGEEVPIMENEQRRFFAANEGKTVLSVEEWERVAGMALALSEEERLRPILAEGKPEVSIFATDPETGVLLKARLDWMAPRATADLKTFTAKRGDSIDKAVCNAIYYEAYYRQACFYDFVRRLATGEAHEKSDFVIAFVESDQPHETRMKKLLPKSGGEVNMYWEVARQEVRGMIRLYAECVNKFGAAPWRTKQSIEPLVDADVRQFSY